jgi:hypothetical protein
MRAYVEDVDFLSFQASVLHWDEQLSQRSGPFALPIQPPLPTEQKAEWEPRNNRIILEDRKIF